VGHGAAHRRAQFARQSVCKAKLLVLHVDLRIVADIGLQFEFDGRRADSVRRDAAARAVALCSPHRSQQYSAIERYM